MTLLRRATRRRFVTANPVTSVLAGQIGLFLSVCVCVALHPGFVLKVNEGGLSNYGIHLKTVLPFTAGFVAVAASSFLAGGAVARATPVERGLRVVLLVYGALMTLTLLTTYVYSLNTTCKDVHVAVGVIQAVFEVAATWWMSRITPRLTPVFVIQVGGFAVAALTFFGAWHLLFSSQVISGAAFAVALVRTTRAVAATAH